MKNSTDYSGISSMVSENVTEKASSQSSMTVVVVKDCKRLNVRNKPSMDGDIVVVLSCGDILEKTSKFVSDTFSEVRLISGIYGYAMTKYLGESI